MTASSRNILRRAAGAIRRRTNRPPDYDPALFLQGPITSIDQRSIFAERNDGGWRGFAGIVTERRWSDIFTLDVFLTQERPRVVVELGTGSGAFSCYLATYAFLADAEFHTFDTYIKGGVTKQMNRRTQRLIRRLGGKAHRRNVFDRDTVALIANILKQRQTAFIYCDNGDKIREVQTFAEYLKPGDFLGVHDYGLEIHPQHLAHLIQPGTFAHWYPELFASTESTNRILERMQ